jgi:hypothetical protein
MGNCPPLLPSGRRRSKNARVVQSGFPGYSGGCGGNVIGYWVDPRTVVCSEIVRFPGLPSRLSSQTRRTSRHNGRLIRHRMSARMPLLHGLVGSRCVLQTPYHPGVDQLFPGHLQWLYSTTRNSTQLSGLLYTQLMHLILQRITSSIVMN